MKKMGLFCISVLFVFSFHIGLALANQSSVSIEAPQTVEKDSEITIHFTVTHNGNNFLHYTKWLKIMINQKEIARWDYTAGQRPETAVFTKEIKVKATEKMEVTAEASCNIHGSKGPATVNIAINE